MAAKSLKTRRVVQQWSLGAQKFFSIMQFFFKYDLMFSLVMLFSDFKQIYRVFLLDYLYIHVYILMNNQCNSSFTLLTLFTTFYIFFFFIINKFVNFRREQFLQWIENLPDSQTPSWLGLPNNAEKVLLTNKGTWNTYLCIFSLWYVHFLCDTTLSFISGSSMIAKLLKMQSFDDDEFTSAVSSVIATTPT